MSKPICLIGFMGTGKSAVGKSLAKLLGHDFVDLDAEIVKAAGHDIPSIFKWEGEDGFREWETRALAVTLLRQNTVIACGGGIVTRPENREALKTNARAVLLTASPETILQRVGNDPNRPLLRSDNPRQHLVDLLRERNPWYNAFGPGIATDGLNIEEVAERVKRLLDA